jgi:hypothetical protein
MSELPQMPKKINVVERHKNLSFVDLSGLKGEIHTSNDDKAGTI